MPDLSFRTNPTDFEIRGDGRTVVGLAVPFDEAADIVEAGNRFTEVFRRGSFRKTIRERTNRVKFLAIHDSRRLPLGAATLLREDTNGLYAELRVSNTTAGDEALELIKDGALDGLSIGFQPIQSKWSRGRTSVERIEAKLHEISAVAWPAYDAAVIAGIRAASPYPPNLYPTDLAVARLRLLNIGMNK